MNGTWKRVTAWEDIIAGLRQRTIATEIQPMLCGTAFKTGVTAHAGRGARPAAAPTDIPTCRWYRSR